MREVCDQCRRVIPSWRRPALHADRLFCDDICLEDYSLMHEQVCDSQRLSPIEDFMLPSPDQQACFTNDP